MALNLTFWFSYEALLHEKRTPQVTIHQGVLQLLTMVAPYLGDDEIRFYHDCEAIYLKLVTDEN
jgi:hypothetical protein